MSIIDPILAQTGTGGFIIYTIIALFIVVVIGFGILLINCYKKVDQGTAAVRNGVGGTKISFTGLFVIPVMHRFEQMDISVKRIEIYRHGVEGLICQDNIRADIKVVFFVRVNKEVASVMEVAQKLGCERASDERAMIELFDAKFSEALKTVGKQFDFVGLYNSRERFKEEILKIIGTDLNGYVLDDAAIDYLEQTPVEKLNPDNILDADGIKKITDLTAIQQILANDIRREKEKTITKQDVEAREAILELERQQAEAEEKQSREVNEIQSRQRAAAEVVAQEERQRSEQARISAEEEIQIAEENKNRQIIVAQKSKERTDAVETERVEKDRQLEVTERERIVTLAQIEKEKAVEVEKKNIQDVIRERVIVERAVVEEEEKIKDTREFAGADREKQVAVTAAKKEAEQSLVMEVQAAEASKQAASRQAETVVIEADARREAASKDTDAKKLLAEATAAEAAAPGLAEAEVINAKAVALEKEGTAEAVVIERKATAEAKGQEAKAEAFEKQGTAEASVIQRKAVADAKGQEATAVATEKQGTADAKVLELKFHADAEGTRKKAEAMKLLDGVGKDHEEFKLRLSKEKDVELAGIQVHQEIAANHSSMVSEALKTARIDIVGGDNKFFDQIVNSVANGKSVDRLVNNSRVLSDVHRTFFDGDPDYFKKKLTGFVDLLGIGSDDVKNLTVAALIAKMMGMTDDDGVRGQLENLLDQANQSHLADTIASTLSVGKSKASAD